MEVDIGELLGRLRQHPLSAPVRLALMVLLLNKIRVEFADAARALGVKPGTLWHHAEKLAEAGYLRIRRGFTLAGPRTYLEATELGVEETLNYLDALRLIASQAVTPTSSSASGGTRRAPRPSPQ